LLEAVLIVLHQMIHDQNLNENEQADNKEYSTVSSVVVTEEETKNVIVSELSIDDDSRASTEAGVIRAMIRSLRTMGSKSIQLPGVGSLPAKAVSRKPPPFLRRANRQVPVHQVAKVSDRVSTGWDLWDSAQTARDNPRSRITAMAMGKY
jgi:hypothetical protein